MDSDFQREHRDTLGEGWEPLVLDRQRVVHSAAFRRLQYKTQVFLSLESDHFRTRLTHTLEVAELARLLARLLELDADLAETVALAHDLGHPPFGHAGERALAVCMLEHGGFEHNVHALRVVEYLEHPYPEFRGLNLTRIVRECLAKHSTRYDRPGRHPLHDGRPAPLEGQVVDVADRLACALHDLQDGLYAGLIEPAALEALDRWNEVYEGRDRGSGIGDQAAGRPSSPDSRSPIPDPRDWRGRLRPVIDRIQRLLVDDVVAETRRRRECFALRTVDDARDAPETIVSLSRVADARLAELEAFLAEAVYGHERLVQMDAQVERTLTDVFGAFVADPRRMPARFAERAPEQGVHRVAADYVAGMTDRYCIDEHARLFGSPAAVADR